MVQLPIPIHRTNRSHEMKPFLFLCHGFVLPAQKQPLNGVPAIKIPNSSVYRHGLSLARRKDRVLKSGRGRQLQNGKFPINNYAKTLTRSSPFLLLYFLPQVNHISCPRPYPSGQRRTVFTATSRNTIANQCCYHSDAHLACVPTDLASHYLSGEELTALYFVCF